ncbi:DUF262 domain-containing protein [Vibrio coralliilyticus]|uniref:DUF262 domain-containing protein n=1 Tax=Vibrio coralliilyticus TaxID=190893 RepID=UPI001C10B009|nr:DUF262 domain-containing protein [Vibrio coralliilyticus]
MSDLTKTQQNIIDEIETATHQLKTDNYAMSIGEIINLYRDGDMILDPAFQRLFRWEDGQKTKLIESILIGIPVPEIFVAQKSDHTWHVVDGVQRLSTILQMAGVLDNYPPLTFESCKYIPSLEGQSWKTLPAELQRSVKRSKLKITILRTTDSDEAQYELFQRLNTGGTNLSVQEVRNCVILMFDEELYNLINELKNYPNFLNCLTLKEEDYEQEEHMELILRMFIGYNNQVKYEEHGQINKIVISEFIDKETIRLVNTADYNAFSSAFKRTFDMLNLTLGENTFKKYDSQINKFKGGFNVSIFEILTIGIASNIDSVSSLGSKALEEKIKDIQSEEEIVKSLGRGVRAIKRFRDTTLFSRAYFK